MYVLQNALCRVTPKVNSQTETRGSAQMPTSPPRLSPKHIGPRAPIARTVAHAKSKELSMGPEKKARNVAGCEDADSARQRYSCLETNGLTPERSGNRRTCKIIFAALSWNHLRCKPVSYAKMLDFWIHNFLFCSKQTAEMRYLTVDVFRALYTYMDLSRVLAQLANPTRCWFLTLGFCSIISQDMFGCLCLWMLAEWRMWR